jgi:MFS family permease
MESPLSLLGERTESVERKGGPGLVALLSVAGLVAGLLTAALLYPAGRLSTMHTRLAWYILGGPFGAALALSLAACRVFRGLAGFWKAVLLVALSIGAYFVSFWVTAGVELLRYRKASMGVAVSYSYFSLFAGGLVGGLLVLGGVFLLIHPKQRFRSLAFKVFFSSVLCGVLAVVGWRLGPSLGMYIWSALHDLGETPPTETFQNALYGERSRQLSLYVVWQTGTAFLLGLILQSRSSKP